MTAAVYRWFLGLSGAELVAYSTLAIGSFVSLACLGVYRLMEWRNPPPSQWPIRFVERPISHDTRWPMLATVAIFAKCGGVR